MVSFQLTKVLVFLIFAGIVVFILLYLVWQDQVKSRDRERKTDLKKVQESVEAYYKENGTYPLLVDLAKDPDKLFAYVYEITSDGKYFLYARLENASDPDVVWGFVAQCGASRCNYMISGSE